MSDANIDVTVDTSQLDELIMRFDAATGRTMAGGISQIGKSSSGRLSNADLRELNLQLAMASGSSYANDPWKLYAKWGLHISDRNLSRFGDFMNNIEKRQAPMDAILASKLPSFSREERIVLNQILPSGALRNYYNIKRLQGGAKIGGYQAGLAAIATGLILLQEIRRLQKQLKVDEEDYKKIFLEYKPDLTKDEFQDIKDQSTNNWTRFLNYVFRGA